MSSNCANIRTRYELAILSPHNHAVHFTDKKFTVDAYQHQNKKYRICIIHIYMQYIHIYMQYKYNIDIVFNFNNKVAC